jgi:hypothetical protein
MEAAHDEPITVGVQQRERKTLVSARVFEWVVADETDPGECALEVSLEERRPRLDLVQISNDLVDSREMRLEDRLQAPLIAAPGDGVQSAGKATRTSCQEDEQEQEHEYRRHQGDDDRREVGVDEGIEIDDRGPPLGW